MIYIINNGDGSSSMYKLETTRNEINDSRIKMSFFGTGWTTMVREKEAVKLKDHGNGVKIKFRSGTKLDLDYSEVEELATLLKFYNEDSECNQFSSKITKLKEIE